MIRDDMINVQKLFIIIILVLILYYYFLSRYSDYGGLYGKKS